MADTGPEQASSPYMAMFEGFRQELDEHHDRRERIIKASRDITAASKKIIFTLQRVRTLGASIPPFAVKSNTPYWEIIEKQYKSIAADLQGINAFRYERQITGGNQEFIESLTFQHYLESQTLITYDDAKARVARLSGEGGAVSLSPEDYILGVFDMIGEVMRFSITAMATNGKVPTGKQTKAAGPPSKEEESEQPADKMDIDEPPFVPSEKLQPRSVLDDLREIRLQLEMFNPPKSKFGDDVEKKMVVMQQCVDKVEKALYSLTVRGSERPKGWVPDVQEDRRSAVESY
ncbi:Translin [Lophiotrema nucula]|uniref:Translin n=1 Tax=Lophiotrema nucula TaxID=690887 RepID=A0A6A5YVM5_9PLEO|nr:Translin [Lophiotrema nucula]